MSGAGVICYSLDRYTRFATPLLLQFVTATSSTATMRGAIDHLCYSLPLLHLELLHLSYCYYRLCYRGAASFFNNRMVMMNWLSQQFLTTTKVQDM